LIRYVNWEERWSYTGSLTTPPCLYTATGGFDGTKHVDSHIFFNVFRKVVYVDPKHIAWLKAEMQKQNKARYGNKAGFKNFFEAGGWTGNHRVVQPLDTQNPVIITEAADPNAGHSPYQAAFIAFLVLFILTLIGFIVACTMLCRAQKTEEEQKPHTQLAQASVEGELKQN
jgi:hypothetical protein